MLSQQNNGPVDEWYDAVENDATEYFETFFKPYFNISKTCSSGTDCGYKSTTPWKYLNGSTYGWHIDSGSDTRFFFYLQDGTFIAIKTGYYPCQEYDDDGNCVSTSGTSYDSEPSIYFDINGPKGPNITGRDVFWLNITTDEGVVPYCHTYSKASVNSNCKRSGSGTCCMRKIMMDSWELTDGYPL